MSYWFSQNFSDKKALCDNLMLQKRSRKIPMRIQEDLALLWRSLSILRFTGMPGAQSAFFAQFLSKLREFPALSLSTGWPKHLYFSADGDSEASCEVDSEGEEEEDVW